MYRYIALLMFALATLAGRADFVNPDFSLPRDVISNADSVLHARKSTPAQRMQAVMQIVTATTAINPDSLAQMSDFVAEQAAHIGRNDFKGLLTLYQARLVNDFFNNHRYQAATVTNVDGPLPDDMNLWSTKQFSAQTAALTDRAIDILSPYMSRPLADYASVINVGEDMAPFFPTLGDFVYSAAVEYNPDTDKYRNDALARQPVGSPAWAWWLCRTANADAVRAAYDKYPGGVTGAYLLLQMGWDDTSRFALADQIRRYLDRNTANILTAALRSRLQQLTLPRIEFSLPQILPVGEPLDVVCTYSDCTDFTVEVYKNNSYSDSYPFKNKTLVTSSRRPGSSAPGLHTDTVRFSLPAGNYLVCVKSPQIDVSRRNYNDFRPLTITSWMPLQLSAGKENRIIVATLGNGAPAKGVNVNCVTPVDNKFKLFGVTDADGQITFTMPKGYYNNWSTVCVNLSDYKKRSVFFANPPRLNMSTIDRHYTATNAAIFADRPLFHFGDTIRWTAVVSSFDYATRTPGLVAEAAIDAKLLDANRQEVSALRLTTDRMGQIVGSFAVPDDRMAGRYSINLYSEGNFIGSGSVTVSDFKMSQFEITNLTVNRVTDNFIVTGTARRYSGAPLADATAKILISNNFYDISVEQEATTDAHGSFMVAIPADSLAFDGADTYSRRCECKATVTSASGEAVDASVSFYAYEHEYLLTLASEGTFCSDSPVKFGATVTDVMGNSVSVTCPWELYAPDAQRGKDAPLYKGKCRVEGGSATLDLTNVPSGRYQLWLDTSYTTVAGSADMADISLYSLKANTLPDVDSFIITRIVFDDVTANAVEVCVGVPVDRYVYIVSYTDAGLPVAKPHRLSAGFHTLAIPVGNAETQRAWVVSFGTDNVYSRPVTINRRVKARQFTLEGEAWRDRMVPGEAERWTLRVADSDYRGAQRRIAATLYNHALDALAPTAWSTNLASMFSPRISRCNYWADIPYMGRTSGSLSASFSRTTFNVNPPKFAYAGAVGMTVMLSEAKYAMNASPTMYRASSADMAAGAVEMVAEEEDAVEEVPDDGNTVPQPVPDDFDYRSAEALQGFWHPEVAVDASGVATISFTVPNANASWTLRATAWSGDCQTASWQAVVTSTKPLMVQPSMPRFMRRGDKATLMFTIINNSDSTQTADTHVEFFDPVTLAVLGAYNFSNSLTAGQQDIVECKIDAAISYSEIGYKVRTTNGRFADGEQGIIPVLDSSVTAINADVFYLTEGNPEFTATLPANADVVALQYCQNPVWEAVKSLPGLYDSEPLTSCAAASSAYAALTARTLLKRFPEIRNVLDIWQSEPADSALVSRLFKNEDLKLEILARTPFVGAANANSEQMQRLAATFNKPTIERVLKGAVEKLAALQNADGGFAWGNWNRQSSVAVTIMTLETLGRTADLNNYARAYGLDKIIDRALGYLDENVKGGRDDMSYTYVYSLYPDHSPSTLEGQQAIDATVQSLIKNWKKLSVTSKARAAMILKAFGSDAVARQVMESVSQFASVDPRQGARFASVRNVDFYSDLLIAFSRIMPGSALIDPLRQWLVIQTQANDDLGSGNPTALVAALISTGSRWTAIRTDPMPDVTVSGQPLSIGHVEAATGAFTQRIEPAAGGSQLVVRRSGDSPAAYGSLVSVAKVPLSEVKARSGEDISLAKRTLVQRGGTWVESTDFRLGERVRVELTLTAGRTFEYLTVSDLRAACLEPVEQMPAMVWSGTAPAYRVVGDNATELFVNYLPRGTYFFSYETTAAIPGDFASGTATVQSQYAPEFTARSGAGRLTVGLGD